MTVRNWGVALATLFSLGFLCSCERHDWKGSTSELFKPHHGHHEDHSKDEDHHGKKEAHAPKEAKEHGGEKGKEHDAKGGEEQEGSVRTVFPQ